MSIKRLLWIVAIVLIVLLLAWPKLKSEKDAAPQASGGPSKAAIPVSVYKADSHSSGTALQVSGTIRAEEEVQLHSELQGRISKIYFTEGTEVKSGQLLLKLHDTEYQAQLKKAMATRKLKEETEQRSRQLLAKGAISQETYDIAQTERSAAGADVELLKDNIDKTELKAPFNGLIGLRSVSEGAVITPSTLIASLQNISSVKLEFAIPEKYVSRLKRNDKVSFTTEGSDKIFNATVYAIEPKVDEQTRTVTVRARCANNERILLPGAFAKVSITLGSNTGSLWIPTQAIVPVLKGKKVFVVQGDSATERMVKTGSRNDAFIEIKEGLTAGDRVIIGGVMYVKNGSRVKVTGKD